MEDVEMRISFQIGRDRISGVPCYCQERYEAFYPRKRPLLFLPFPEIRPFVIEVIGHEKISFLECAMELSRMSPSSGVQNPPNDPYLQREFVDPEARRRDENEMEGRSGRESEDKSEQVRGRGIGMSNSRPDAGTHGSMDRVGRPFSKSFASGVYAPSLIKRVLRLPQWPTHPRRNERSHGLAASHRFLMKGRSWMRHF